MNEIFIFHLRTLVAALVVGRSSEVIGGTNPEYCGDGCYTNCSARNELRKVSAPWWLAS